MTPHPTPLCDSPDVRPMRLLHRARIAQALLCHAFGEPTHRLAGCAGCLRVWPVTQEQGYALEWAELEREWGARSA
jgi:hypothetical protein